MKHVGPNRLQVMKNKNTIMHNCPKAIMHATQYVSLVHLVDPHDVDDLSNSALGKNLSIEAI